MVVGHDNGVKAIFITGSLKNSLDLRLGQNTAKKVIVIEGFVLQ